MSCYNLQSANFNRNFVTSYREVESRLRATVAFLNPDNERIFCSGFFVSPRNIISAAHCFEPTADLTLPNGTVAQIPTGIDPTGLIVHYINYGDLELISNRLITPPKQATIVNFNRENDMVILEISAVLNNHENNLRFSQERPSVGNQVYGIGHPLGLAWSFQNGIISRILTSPNNGSIFMLQTNVPVSRGNSGGPLLNSEGEVIGMAVAYVSHMPHLSIFISVEQLRAQYQNYLFQRRMRNTYVH